MLITTALLLLCCTYLQGAQLSAYEEIDLEKALDHFLVFVKRHNKVYEHGEAARRYQNFVRTLELINQRNKLNPGSHAINIFADMSSEEFTRTKLGYVPMNYSTILPPVDRAEEGFTAPETFDWRDKNAVTPIKDQGQCGSCWAFSAVAVIESQYAIRKQSLQQFSEQQILDCDSTDMECRGGEPSSAFSYVQQAGGLESESDYPYIASAGQCSFQADKAAVQVTNPQSSSMTEDEMVEKLASYGPLSVVICAAELQTYAPGSIWNPTNCPNDLNSCVDEQNRSHLHAVTLVGYGTDPSPYWILRNSWGNVWGEDGYFRMIRGTASCLITSTVATVSVA